MLPGEFRGRPVGVGSREAEGRLRGADKLGGDCTGNAIPI